MAKSLRSKIKRKHRREFRATIGTEAYNATFAKTQAKFKEYMEQQSMNSFERLAKTLGTQMDTTTDEDTADDVKLAAANETTTSTPEDKTTASSTTTTTANKTTASMAAAKDFRGVNKAVFRREQTRKHRMTAMGIKMGSRIKQLKKRKNAA